MRLLMEYSFKFIKKHITKENLALIKAAGKIVSCGVRKNKTHNSILSDLKGLFVWKHNTQIGEDYVTIINGDFYISFCKHPNITNKICMVIALKRKFPNDYNIHMIKSINSFSIYMYKDVLYEEESELQHEEELYYILNKNSLNIYGGELEEHIHKPIIEDIFSKKYISDNDLYDLLKIKYDYSLNDFELIDNMIDFRLNLEALIKLHT